MRMFLVLLFTVFGLEANAQSVIKTTDNQCLAPDSPGYEQAVVFQQYETAVACVREGGRLMGLVDANSAPCDLGRIEILLQTGSREAIWDPTSPCQIQQGRWQDRFSGEWLTSTRDIHLAHIIPLGYAMANGGQQWHGEQLRAFITDPRNIVVTAATSASARQSGSPIDWMPANRAFSCQYLQKWRQLSDDYRLPLSKQDEQAMLQLATKSGCNPMLLVSTRR